ncbi:MAG: 3-isopropylmalate dehydratase small subunit [Betaproteobacteria bacterium]|nr:3-isopropylmalate dehydratase small subunit [Betaproteobacteria bacterium]MBI2293549.1 3-isopropylmalate dehydratase small subunit [Betaproteobacteria bacterium]MBI3053507.1 3-isopropylmalate dehydratase small subunit [Betaproteobacteria bacterium]
MEAFTTLRAVAVPYYHADVDTDELIPHRFLRKPLSAGYGNFLFYDKRHGSDDREDPAFVLNKAPYRRAQVLVSGRNFGCGSTREGAVYALRDYGIRAVIAPSLADIFSGNCVQNGVLPVALPERSVEALCAQLEAEPGAEVRIDLADQSVTMPDGTFCRFEIEQSRKTQLFEGLDEIEITLKHRDAIARFEAQYCARLPWLAGSRSA